MMRTPLLTFLAGLLLSALASVALAEGTLNLTLPKAHPDDKPLIGEISSTARDALKRDPNAPQEHRCPDGSLAIGNTSNGKVEYTCPPPPGMRDLGRVPAATERDKDGKILAPCTPNSFEARCRDPQYQHGSPTHKAGGNGTGLNFPIYNSNSGEEVHLNMPKR